MCIKDKVSMKVELARKGDCGQRITDGGSCWVGLCVQFFSALSCLPSPILPFHLSYCHLIFVIQGLPDVISPIIVIGDYWVTSLPDLVWKSGNAPSICVTSSDNVRAQCCWLSSFPPLITTTVNTATSHDQPWVLIGHLFWTLPLMPQPCHTASWETLGWLNKGFPGRVVPLLLRHIARCLSAVCRRKGATLSWAHSRFNQTAVAPTAEQEHCQSQFDLEARDVGKQNRLSGVLYSLLCRPSMVNRTGWQ